MTDASSERCAELLRHGELAFERGLYQRAIHLWTRVLFLDRRNDQARRGIARAKAALAERQRELDAAIAQARDCLENGRRDEASRLVEKILASDPRHPDVHELARELTAADRRSAPVLTESRAHERTQPTSSASTGSSSARARRPVLRRRAERAPAASTLKMAFFLLAAVLVFASGALYLRLNWESIVSDGAFGTNGPLDARTPLQRELPFVPDAGEMRYFNAERLAANGRYREALDELARIDRSAPIADKARSLTLRIEERLLRGVFDETASNSAEAR